MTDASKSNRSRDLIERGSKTPTPIGKATFVGLRGLDPFLQYQILRHGLLNPVITSLGGTIANGAAPLITGTALDVLQLSPYRLLLFAMGIGSMLKQNYWVTLISGEPMPVPASVMVGILNSTFNSLNALFFLNSYTTVAADEYAFPPARVLLGTALYSLGLYLEWYSEIQRKNFKQDPKNKGKAYTGGLWAYARHINYGGYTLWRTGFALVGGGWLWAAATAALSVYGFVGSSIPILDEYCSERYAEQWLKFKRDTPYQLLPGLI